MQHMAAREMLDLLAATGAVGADQRVGRGLDGGYETVTSDGLGHGVMIGCVAERAGHAAAAGVDQLDRLARQGAQRSQRP